MREPIVKLTDSAGQSVVIVTDMVTHLVAGGDAHTEVHLVGGTYVRIKGPIDDLTARFWPASSWLPATGS